MQNIYSNRVTIFCLLMIVAINPPMVSQIKYANCLYYSHKLNEKPYSFYFLKIDYQLGLATRIYSNGELDNQLSKTTIDAGLIMTVGISMLALLLFIMVIYFSRSRRKYILLNAELLMQKQKIGYQAEEHIKSIEHLIDKNEEIAQQREEINAQTDSLADSLKKLRDLSEFKEGLMAMIVHDLKNPLNTIINQTKNVLVSESAIQMLTMVNNILDLQKFESTQMPTNKKKCNLDTIIKNALFNTRYLTEQKNISLKNEILHEYQVFTDPDLIERVSTNLLTNAIKYSPMNGWILINAEPINQTTLKVFVTDNGPGITENLKHLVFQKYSQLIARDSGHARPTGLGLTFCKMAIEALDGKIGLETKIGEGTSFWFTLALVETPDLERKRTNIQVPEIKQLKSETIEQINPYIKQLKLYEVYEISEIQKIISQIKAQNFPGIESWLKAVENSVYSVNSEEFHSLLIFFNKKSID